MAKTHSDTELRKASDHLFYEIWMMNRLATILGEGVRVPIPERTVSYTNTPRTTVIMRSTGIINSSETSNREDDMFRVTNNAIVEAFAIHVRSLLDFFYKVETDDDVVAEHFFSSPEVWVNARPPKSQDEIRKIKVRVNKEIAHLTYARQNVKSKIWPYKRLQGDLNRAFKIFSDLVPKNLLGKRWK